MYRCRNAEICRWASSETVPKRLKWPCTTLLSPILQWRRTSKMDCRPLSAPPSCCEGPPKLWRASLSELCRPSLPKLCRCPAAVGLTGGRLACGAGDPWLMKFACACKRSFSCQYVHACACIWNALTCRLSCSVHCTGTYIALQHLGSCDCSV